MDGTVEQPAHTNDKTLTGREEIGFVSVSIFHFFLCVFSSCCFCFENNDLTGGKTR